MAQAVSCQQTRDSRGMAQAVSYRQTRESHGMAQAVICRQSRDSRGMAQTVSCRLLSAETRIKSMLFHVRRVVDKEALGLVVSLFHRQYHS
jgi:hypothetical protein